MQERRVYIAMKHVFICNNHCIYTNVIQEVYNQDCSPENDDVEGLAATASKYIKLFKQMDMGEGSFIL